MTPTPHADLPPGRRGSSSSSCREGCAIIGRAMASEATLSVEGGGRSRWRDRDRIVAGISPVIAKRLRVPVWLVRSGFAVLALFGFGIILYAALVVAMPGAGDEAEGAAGLFRAAAVAIIAAGALLVSRRLGLWSDDDTIWSLLVVAIGAAVIWQRAEAFDRERRRRGGAADRVTETIGGRSAAIRLAVGALLIVAGVAGLLAAVDALADARDGVIAIVLTGAGVALILGPWLLRLGRAYTEERSGRIRAQEREEMAARIHDSTLQTLALIQRSAGDAAETQRLARRGERELRGWLFPEATAAAGGLNEAVEEMTADVEELFDVRVEAVTVGDAPMTEPLRALIAGVREALVNAAKFSGRRRIDLFVEVEDGTARAYVRDDGSGFDPDAIPPDRHGIRDSIIGRLERHDGRAAVTSSPGSGTEVEFEIEIEAGP